MSAATPSRSSGGRKILPAQQKMRELVQSGLTRAGLNFEELDGLYHQSKSEFATENEKRLSETLKQSAALTKAFQSDLKGIQGRLNAVKNFAPLNAPINLTLLDVATSITSDNVTLSATNMAPQNNWAQFEYSTESSGGAGVTFAYQWTNSSDVYVVINIVGFISFNGALVAATDGSFWPDNQHSHSSINAYLGASVLPSGPSFQGITLTGPTLHADSSGWLGDPGDYETATVFRGLPPDCDVVVIPPQTSLQIDVVGQFYADIDGGYADFNFQGDGRQVASLGVIVSIIS